MAILRSEEIRKIDVAERDKRLGDLRLELAKERGNIHIGGTVTSPGRVREIRRTIARILTINSEKPRQVKNITAKPKQQQELVKKGVQAKSK